LQVGRIRDLWRLPFAIRRRAKTLREKLGTK
jgi:hypothetical protein